MDLYKELTEYLEALKIYRGTFLDKLTQGQSAKIASYLSSLISKSDQNQVRYTAEELIEVLRERLIRKTGALKGKLIELTNKQYFGGGGSRYDIWFAAFNRDMQHWSFALDTCIDAVNEAIGILENGIKEGTIDARGDFLQAAELQVKSEPPKAFIAHGGETKARNKLQRFLTALGVQPLIIEEEPKEARSPNEQVEYCLKQASCAVILGTADDKELKDGKLYPRRNVHIEIGRVQEIFPMKTVFLLEEGASFPTNISEKLYTRFTQESMDEAFITVARELKTFGILKPVTPPKEHKF